VAEILGLGVTHYPGLMVPDAQMATVLVTTLASDRVPPALKDPARWPEPMRREWGGDGGTTAAVEHRRRLVEGFRAVRKQLDAFAPDFVLIFGDDQYENFREDLVPPFCVFAFPEVECRPHARHGLFGNANVWGEGPDARFRVRGHPAGGKYLAARLLAAGFDMPYAYRSRYELGLAHAFINTVLYLDYDRQGFPYPVVPFHVNCYGASVIRHRGGLAHLEALDAADADPPGPSAARCFEVGAATARILGGSPWRVAVVASSSWSHAFLTAKTHWLHADLEADRTRVEELRAGRFAGWRELTRSELEDAGQHEFLNWVCLAGAMHALGRRAQVLDFVETWIFNSSKCFAVFPP
jgi:hypothetical protein